MSAKVTGELWWVKTVKTFARSYGGLDEVRFVMSSKEV